MSLIHYLYESNYLVRDISGEELTSGEIPVRESGDLGGGKPERQTRGEKVKNGDGFLVICFEFDLVLVIIFFSVSSFVWECAVYLN